MKKKKDDLRAPETDERDRVLIFCHSCKRAGNHAQWCSAKNRHHRSVTRATHQDAGSRDS